MKKIKMARGVAFAFEEGRNKYMENYRQRNLREGTIGQYRQSYVQFYKYFGKDLLVSEITEEVYQKMSCICAKPCKTMSASIRTTTKLRLSNEMFTALAVSIDFATVFTYFPLPKRRVDKAIGLRIAMLCFSLLSFL